MDLPLFYKENTDDAYNLLTLDEETSKHVVQVLRMGRGDLLRITDGNGRLLTAEIVKDHKKHCEVKIIDSAFSEYPARKISIAISLLKNASRFEWFLEKATEIGIREIIPMICERTEKQHFRYDRMKNICISAMLQSQQVWMPKLPQPIKFNSLFENLQYHQRLIAHCNEGEKRNLSATMEPTAGSTLILIGPEGDFTSEEVALAGQNEFRPVSLGETRLRAETAAVVAAAVLALG
jgi:16S rRNA (uracil1498-N3)-methyltransferase